MCARTHTHVIRKKRKARKQQSPGQIQPLLTNIQGRKTSELNAFLYIWRCSLYSSWRHWQAIRLSQGRLITRNRCWVQTKGAGPYHLAPSTSLQSPKPCRQATRASGYRQHSPLSPDYSKPIKGARVRAQLFLMLLEPTKGGCFTRVICIEIQESFAYNGKNGIMFASSWAA